MPCYCVTKPKGICTICLEAVATTRCSPKSNCGGVTCENCKREWRKYKGICHYCRQHYVEFSNISKDHVIQAVQANHLECFHKVRKQVRLKYSDLCLPAVLYGSSDILQFLIELGCTINSNTLRIAVESGHIECIKLLFEHYPIKPYLVEVAFRFKHVDCLEYMAKLKGNRCAYNYLSLSNRLDLQKIE